MIDLISDEYFMRMALAEGQHAFDEGEVPVGAVLVSPRGRVIGRGHNLTEALADVTAHAEIIAIGAASQALGGKYLEGCTLYVTVEPCVMCAGAIAWSRPARLVIGCPDDKRGYSRYTARSPFHPRTEIVAGVLEAECRGLMQQFFQSLRK